MYLIGLNPYSNGTMYLIAMIGALKTELTRS